MGGMRRSWERPCSIERGRLSAICPWLRRTGSAALEVGPSFHAFSGNLPVFARNGGACSTVRRGDQTGRLGRCRGETRQTAMRASRWTSRGPRSNPADGRAARARHGRATAPSHARRARRARRRTALLGRTFGLHDVRFLGSEVALLAAIFVVSRYVLPLVERHDRGATGEEQVGSLLGRPGGRRLARDPRREPRTRQRRPHPDRPGGRVHGRDQEPSRPRARGARPRRDAAPGPRPAAGDRSRDGPRGRAADRLQPRLGGPPAGAAQGRARAAGANAARVPGEARRDALAAGGRAGAGARGFGAGRAPSAVESRSPAAGLRHAAPRGHTAPR